MTSDIESLLGVERDLEDVNLSLRNYVRSLNAPVVGALQVTCADEAEWECVDAFQRCFVNSLLPDLKFARKSAFHLSNLGARYEPHAIAVAEHHFATPEARSGFKVLLVKLNSHVAIEGEGERARFGRIQRFETESECCGALHALLRGGGQPFVHELRAVFGIGGHDRLALLRDAAHVKPAQRGLCVALVNARLQARRVEDDISVHEPHGPTLYLVISSVTLNRPGPDTELLCGLSTIDHRGSERVFEYQGLSDDPGRYRVHFDLGRLHVRDDQLSG